MKYFQYYSTVLLGLLVIMGCEIENNPVELISLAAIDSSNQVITSPVCQTGDVMTLYCEAQDGDGDKLVYNWESSSGSLSVDRDTARWTAPNRSGFYHVTCKVSDGVGASDAGNISIRVVGSLLKGTVTNAVNGEGVSDVTVTVGGSTGSTDENGDYTIYSSFDSGEHDVSGVRESFCPYNGIFQVSEDYASDTYTYNFSLSPIPEVGEIRMVLNWGAEPRDLDSHLKTPEIDGQAYHISYSNRGNATSPPYATLDIDKVDGYGPETVTIKQSFSGTYIYYIYQYSSAGSLPSSGGTIQIYNSPDCDGETFQVPNQGNGRFWYVCDIDGDSGDITIINQIQDSEPSP